MLSYVVPGLCVTDEFDKARNEFLARCKSDAYGVSKLDVSEFGDQGAVLPAGVDVEENGTYPEIVWL